MELLLDETDLKIKDGLYKIINGDYDKMLTPEQIEYFIKISFLYNHIICKDGHLLFEYNGNKVKINDISDYSMISDSKNYILSMITNEDIFKNALKSFLRDNKINKIIN